MYKSIIIKFISRSKKLKPKCSVMYEAYVVSISCGDFHIYNFWFSWRDCKDIQNSWSFCIGGGLKGPF
jgi:hypothetical protein